MYQSYRKTDESNILKDELKAVSGTNEIFKKNGHATGGI